MNICLKVVIDVSYEMEKHDSPDELWDYFDVELLIRSRIAACCFVNEIVSLIVVFGWDLG